MKITRVIAVAVMAGTAGLTALDAQSLRDAAPPAEFPPASYTGNQYVDSRGCIYIRAGIDGNVTWVPRVSRDRKQVCGYKPTAVAGSTKTPQQSASVEQITLPPTAQPTATAKTPAPTASAAPSARKTQAGSARAGADRCESATAHDGSIDENHNKTPADNDDSGPCAGAADHCDHAVNLLGRMFECLDIQSAVHQQKGSALRAANRISCHTGAGQFFVGA